MKPPADLGDKGRAYWRVIVRHWKLDEHHHEVLAQACKCLDMIDAAQVELVKSGPFERDRFGQLRASPAVNVVRDYRGLFAGLVRELGLSAEPAAEEPSRPPALTGRYLHRA